MITLFPDQRQAVDGVISSMRAGNRSVLLQAATGFGKSYVATHIASRALAKGSSIMMMVPRKDLLGQMSSTFTEFGIEHSFIAPQRFQDPDYSACIASTETLRRRLDRTIAPDIAIIDECHFGGAGLDSIVRWLKDSGSWIIGLSATPWKMSGKGLGCWFDDMVMGPSIRWLIDNKRLSDYRAFSPDRPDLSGIAISNGDYAKGQLSDKMEHDRVLIGNAVAHYKSHALGKLGVTFGVSRRHSELLAQAYRDAGIPAAHVDGETPMDKRREIFVAYARREMLQLCNAELLTFGFDISMASGVKNVTVESITDCQPTLSIAKQMQKWGRGLRYDNGEPHLFFDHANNFSKHGTICQDRKWTLADREKGKRDGADEKLIAVKECPECYRVHRPAPSCPNCGHIYPVQSRDVDEIDGELKELSKEEIINFKKQERREVGMARSIADLKKIQQDRGYKPSWVWIMAKAKGIKA